MPKPQKTDAQTVQQKSVVQAAIKIVERSKVSGAVLKAQKSQIKKLTAQNAKMKQQLATAKAEKRDLATSNKRKQLNIEDMHKQMTKMCETTNTKIANIIEQNKLEVDKALNEAGQIRRRPPTPTPMPTPATGTPPPRATPIPIVADYIPNYQRRPS